MTAKRYANPGFVLWWLRWWFETRGIFAGVLLPIGLALAAWRLDARLIPLGIALGLGMGLLWTTGKAGRGVVYVGIGLALLPFFSSVLDLIFRSLLALLFVVWLVRRFAGKREAPEPAYHAHWATPQETSDMVVGGRRGHPVGDGVLVGMHDDRAIGIRPGLEGRREMGHMLVCGPNRSGKSLHLITNLMLWQGSTVALDIKGELYRRTAEKRKALGNEVYVLDPSGRGNRYDPFGELSYSPEAMKVAARLVMEPDKGRESIFAERGMAAFLAAALGARLEGVPTLPYLREVTAEGPMWFSERLAGLKHPEVRRNLVEFLGARPEDMGPKDYRDDRFLASAWSTMIPRISPLMSEGVLKMTGGSDFRAADLVERPTSLYLMFAESELGSTQKAFQLVLLSLITGLIRRGDLDPDEQGVPMLLALDEAGRTPIPRLDDLVSTIAGRGMSALIYVQDLGQLESAYDRDRAKTIRGNCHTQLFYRPADLDTASFISRRSGKTSVQDVRVSSGDNHESTSYGMRERELITADEVMQIDSDKVFAFAGNKPPILARRLEWFRDLPGASEFVRDNPPPAPPELPLPEGAGIVTAEDGVRGEGAGPEIRRPAKDPPPIAPENGEGVRRGAGTAREGGYVEPDV